MWEDPDGANLHQEMPPEISCKRPSRRLTLRSALWSLAFAAVMYWLFASFVLPGLRDERTLHGHTRSVDCLAFSPDGSRLFSGGYDGKVLAWNLETFEPELIADLAPHPVNALAVSPDGSLLAIASDFDRKIMEGGEEGGFSPGSIQALVVELRKGARVAELRSPLDPVVGLVFAPARAELYAADSSGRLTVWDTQKWTLKSQQQESSGGLIALSPEGNLLALAAWGQVRLFDPNLRPVGRGLERSRWKGWGLAFAPDGKGIAFTNRDNVVLVDPGDGSVAHVLPAPEQIRAVAYSPDGRLIASGSMTGSMLFGFSGRLQVWRVDSGELVLSRRGSEIVTAVAFSPDGRYLAAADGEGAILLIRSPK